MKSKYYFCCASEIRNILVAGWSSNCLDACLTDPWWDWATLVPGSQCLLSASVNLCIGSLYTELISGMDFVVCLLVFLNHIRWQWICISYLNLSCFLECDDSLCRYLTLGVAASLILIQHDVSQWDMSSHPPHWNQGISPVRYVNINSQCGWKLKAD